MANAEQTKANAAQTTESESVLDAIFREGIRPSDETEKQQAAGLIETFVRTQTQPGMIVSKDTQRTLDSWIAAIDKKITDQLNLVMHEPEFQKLEASWRGLHYLVHQSETGTDLKIRVLNASKKD